MADPRKAPAPTAQAQGDHIHHLLHPSTVCLAGCQSCTGMSPKQGQQSHQFFPVKEFCISYKLLTALQERISAMKYKGCIVLSSSSLLFILSLKRKRHWRKCGVWSENGEKEGNCIPHGEEKYKTAVQNLDLIMYETAFDSVHRYGSRNLWNQGTSFTFDCFFHFSTPAICMEHSSRGQTQKSMGLYSSHFLAGPILPSYSRYVVCSSKLKYFWVLPCLVCVFCLLGCFLIGINRSTTGLWCVATAIRTPWRPVAISVVFPD